MFNSRFLFRVFTFILLFASISSCIITRIRSQDYIESFSSHTPSPNFWHSKRHDLTFLIDDDRDYALFVKNPISNYYNYYKSVDLASIKPNFSSIDLNLKFSSNSISQGAGYLFSDNVPAQGSTLLFSSYMFYVWPKPNGSFHLFSSICPELTPNCNLSLQLSNGVYAMPTDGQWHNLSVKRINSHYEWFIDNSIIFKTEDTLRLISSVGIGNPENTSGNQFWPTLYIDYFALDYEYPSTFPYLSQKDPAWGSQEYDKAQSWAGIDKTGIDRWGCALTSAAMILQKYDVKTDTGATVNPEILNSWLKSQPDGYVGPGLLNWLAVTRFAKNSFDVGQASTKLEYERSYLPSAPILPAILSTGSHFVVAHSEDVTNWLIHDPANSSNSQMSKTTNIKSINRFVPSNTDLSYMLFSSHASVSATLRNEIGELTNIDWDAQYLSDDQGGDNTPTIYVGLVPKPPSGRYVLEVEQPSNTTTPFNIYLYDLDGETIQESYTMTEPRTKFEFNYSVTNSHDSQVSKIDITPPPIPTLISPENGDYKNTSGLVLDWTDEIDESMPVTYNYKSTWDGGKYGPVNTSTNSFIAANGTPDNSYVWYVQACDSVGNCSEWANRILHVDSTQPRVDLVYPPPGPSSNYFEVVFSELVNPVEATNGANYYLANWPDEPGSGDLLGDAEITYSFDNRTARVILTNPGWYISSEQLWGVENIHDLAGNLITPNPYSEYSTPMLAPIVEPPTTVSAVTNSTTQIWSWLAATDLGSGVKGYSTKTFDVKNQQYLSDWLWIGQVFGTSTNLQEGQWKLYLQATDKAGNVGDSRSSEILSVDTSLPSTPINLHFENPSLDCGSFTNRKFVTIDWDEAVDNHELAGYEYHVEYPLGLSRGNWTTFLTSSFYHGSLNEGIHYIKVRAKDTAGNYSHWSNSCSITYDSESPILSDKTTFSGWYRSGQTSYFDFKDTNLADNYMAPFCEISSEGETSTCTITPNVCDKAGNCFRSALTSNTAKIDSTNPLIEIRAWGSTINGVASDTLSGLDKIQLKITKPDKSEITVIATGTANWSYTMSEAPFGDYKVIVTAYDGAQNTSEASKEFVMSPPAGNPEVLGLTTSRESESESESELIDLPVTQQPMTPLPSTAGVVLAETDTFEEVSKIRYSWILLIIIPFGLLAAYLIKRK